MSSPSPLCYVSIPFGLKSLGIGREIDFDDVYRDLVKPAATLAGFEAVRGDEFVAAGVLPRQLEQVVQAEAMVADLSALNPNVFYELGVRHATRPQGTVLISAARQPVPFDLISNLVTFYDPSAPMESVTALSDRLRRLAQDDTVDSPVYQVVPGLSVSLPRVDLGSSRSVPSTAGGPDLRREIAYAVRDGSPQRLQELEPAVSRQSGQDARLVIDLLLAFRDVGAWGDVLRIAQELPPAARDDDSVVQLLAFALIRRGGPGDVDQAVQLLERVVARLPDDGAAWSLLGRAYRERWATMGEHAALDRAIEAYRRAWDIDRDVYAATNLGVLLARRGDYDELQSFLPQARAVAADDLASGRADFWRISNALELAVLAGDGDDAIRLATRARAVAPGRGALESIGRTLEDDVGSAGGRPRIVRNVVEVLTAESETDWG